MDKMTLNLHFAMDEICNMKRNRSADQLHLMGFDKVIPRKSKNGSAKKNVQ